MLIFCMVLQVFSDIPYIVLSFNLACLTTFSLARVRTAEDIFYNTCKTERVLTAKYCKGVY